MKNQQLSRVAFAFVAALGCMVNSAMAQQQGAAVTQGGTQQAVPQTRIAQPAIAPMPSSPRMGFMGQMLYGYGMRVLSVNYGSPAGQLGLERGDVVFSINGRRILSQFDYDQALINAAMYRGGLVSLTVRNIRFDYGQSFQEFVNVSTVLPGYGGVYPVAGVQAGPVAARSTGGQSQGQVRQRQGQVIQGQTRSVQARSRVREVARDKVPAMKSGDSGSSQ